ncbi:NAD(P)/FAD-dependent oxidoreductase [Hymenobacter setariae]|uniref:NAD(P)/FAD-dependent oxidoreductase n=1 Tax=Hymenobacter setariae TaxID=2594794 RepID=A0A558BV70_9BACT|nr:NAD(P)/FAD-dependent oxidoreductase [Hymenobacter setariae]TVT40372.1 NAD(P)/FAD-dependent oxidoreductase [Hymenobacter setariae]
MHSDYDVLVIGAGSAGLSAALTLGRCRRRVLVADGGPTRNAPSGAVHSFFSRDGIRPAALLHIGREQLAPYPTVEVREFKITALTKLAQGFEATGQNGQGHPTKATARRVLLATGVDDVLPPLPGFRELWGSSVLHCPYCHGYEVRDQPLAVYGQGKAVAGLALLISRWSADVIIVTNGPGHLTDYARQRLRRQGIVVREEPIARLVGTARGGLRCVEFTDGSYIERSALFLHPPQEQRSTLAADLGARLTGKGAVWVDKNAQTTVPGLYAAGDMVPGQQQALLAAASGSKAAICLNEGLTRAEVT